MTTIWYIAFAIAEQAQAAFHHLSGLETSQLFDKTWCALAVHIKINLTLWDITLNFKKDSAHICEREEEISFHMWTNYHKEDHKGYTVIWDWEVCEGFPNILLI